MHFGTLDITAPAVLAGEYNQAEVLGAAVWLWMHSCAHRDARLHTLSTLLLPAIANGQFVLASEADRPVAYVSWAMFDTESEACYLKNPRSRLPDAGWSSGDRMWFLDWVVPFGHARAMRDLLANVLFRDRCARALHHTGGRQGRRILKYRGAAMPAQAVRAWFASRSGSAASTGKVQCPFQVFSHPLFREGAEGNEHA
jgi:cytolysin-activating lysine-acyltransferase